MPDWKLEEKFVNIIEYRCQNISYAILDASVQDGNGIEKLDTR